VAGVQARAVDDEAELAAAFNRAYRAGDWHGALEIGLEIEASTPGRPIHRYNLACVAARAGDGDRAVEWLGRAAASGFWRLPQLERDQDLDGIRAHPGFDEAAAAVAGNYRAFRTIVEQRFAATPPLLIMPPDHRVDEPAPVVVALHGHGGRASGYPTLWRRAATRAGAVLVIPQAVRESGPGFTWQDPDEAGLIVDLTLDWVRRQVAVDDGSIVLTGFSEGGFVAMVIGTRQPDRFVGVIPMAGGYLPELDAPPRTHAGRVPRYYFMVGSLDRSADAVRRAADDHRDAGYPTRLRVLPGTGHTFPRDTDRELGRALRFALGDSSD
jgi:phospholipase/carboxylesterase